MGPKLPDLLKVKLFDLLLVFGRRGSRSVDTSVGVWPPLSLSVPGPRDAKVQLCKLQLFQHPPTPRFEVKLLLLF